MPLLFIPSGGEMLFIAVVVLMLFGADKIPEIMRIVGKGMREFRNATDELKREFQDSTQEITRDFKEEKDAIQKDINGYKQKLTDEFLNEKPQKDKELE